MKGILGKYEPVYYEVKEQIDETTTAKHKVRKIKLSIYVDPEDFPDVTAYDGAFLQLFRPEESITGDVDAIKVKELAYRALAEAMKILEP